MTRLEDMTLEEKVDELLRSQRRAHRMAVIRSVVSLVLFFVLVILPLVGFYYWIRNFQDHYGTNINELMETVKKTGDINDIEGLEALEDLLR